MFLLKFGDLVLLLLRQADFFGDRILRDRIDSLAVIADLPEPGHLLIADHLLDLHFRFGLDLGHFDLHIGSQELAFFVGGIPHLAENILQLGIVIASISEGLIQIFELFLLLIGQSEFLERGLVAKFTRDAATPRPSRLDRLRIHRDSVHHPDLAGQQASCQRPVPEPFPNHSLSQTGGPER